MSESTLDQRLLQLLQQDARISTSALARKLGVSRSTVNNRLQRLEANGVIAGYTLRLGSEYLAGLITAHVLVKVNQKLTAQVNRDLIAIPEVIAVYAISGDYDLIAEVRSATTAGLNQLLDAIGNLDGVERTNSSVILETRLRR
ncbi:MAG: Lrp/AsnC family transcriptional regulator [Pseudomonadales bacterium]|nr:Lrp/AsnC family transcriptional regulator [Pseudomonadales bacterium]